MFGMSKIAAKLLYENTRNNYNRFLSLTENRKQSKEGVYADDLRILINVKIHKNHSLISHVLIQLNTIFCFF